MDLLPVELIENIVNNVSARTLWKVIRPLNKTFYSAVSSRDYWLRRIKNTNNIDLLPRIRNSQDLRSLVKLSVLSEENIQRFDENDCLTDYLICTRHISTPDAFHSQLIDGRRMLFTGARDHKIVIWDLQKAAEEKNLQNGIKFEFVEAHDGWIWAIAAYEERTFFTSSWDQKIKCWRYGESAVMESCYNAIKAVVALTTVDKIIIGSVYGGQLHFCDFRQQDKLIHELNLRCSTAIGIYADQKGYGLVAGTENGKLILYDRRFLTKPVRKTKPLDRIRTFQYSNGTQLSACSRTQAVIFDPATLDIELDFTAETGTSPYYCIPTESGYFCTDNFDITYYSGGQNPRKITQTTFSNRISTLRYFDGDLIAGLGEGSIQVWPKEQLFNGRLNIDPPDNSGI
uniref:F-box domain-containing protein n=1 Tax=Panagrolaimus sp. PS1159 TaxID=55785 RepID=A0AC35F6L7_9BILA